MGGGATIYIYIYLFIYLFIYYYLSVCARTLRTKRSNLECTRRAQGHCRNIALANATVDLHACSAGTVQGLGLRVEG